MLKTNNISIQTIVLQLFETKWFVYRSVLLFKTFVREANTEQMVLFYFIFQQERKQRGPVE